MSEFSAPRCNCPDAIQSRIGQTTARFPSRYFSQAWTDAVGIKDIGGYCKHEMAVLIIREELDKAYPNGVPYRPKIEPLSSSIPKPVKFAIDSESSIIKPYGGF